MVERSLVSFVVRHGGDGVRRPEPWHVFALRAVQGLFAGYGALALTMAADSAPRERMAYAIGIVQTAQRLGPALGPVIGGVVAQVVGLRSAFLVTAAFYVVALADRVRACTTSAIGCTHEPATHDARAASRSGTCSRSRTSSC